MFKLFGFIALAAIMSFSMAGCDSGTSGGSSGEPPVVVETFTFSGTSLYTMEVYRNPGRYTYQAGDHYKLTVVSGDDTFVSRGGVVSFTASTGRFVLRPNDRLTTGGMQSLSDFGIQVSTTTGQITGLPPEGIPINEGNFNRLSEGGVLSIPAGDAGRTVEALRVTEEVIRTITIGGLGNVPVDGDLVRAFAGNGSITFNPPGGYFPWGGSFLTVEPETAIARTGQVQVTWIDPGNTRITPAQLNDESTPARFSLNQNFTLRLTIHRPGGYVWNSATELNVTGVSAERIAIVDNLTCNNILTVDIELPRSVSPAPITRLLGLTIRGPIHGETAPTGNTGTPRFIDGLPDCITVGTIEWSSNLSAGNYVGAVAHHATIPLTITTGSPSIFDFEGSATAVPVSIIGITGVAGRTLIATVDASGQPHHGRPNVLILASPAPTSQSMSIQVTFANTLPPPAYTTLPNLEIIGPENAAIRQTSAANLFVGGAPTWPANVQFTTAAWETPTGASGAWENASGTDFAPDTAYRLMITLTATAPYSFGSVGLGNISKQGNAPARPDIATRSMAVTGSGDTILTITLTFDETPN
jgi:hypothetical protein